MDAARVASLAAEIGISERVLRAIFVVESGGRLDAMRFEPRLFHAFTSRDPDCQAGGSACTKTEIRANIRYSQIPWADVEREGLLPRNQVNKAAFDKAFALDPAAAAVEASSWGPGQVLGSSLLKVAGPSPSAAVAAFYANPEDIGAQLLVDWFKGSQRRKQAALDAGVDLTPASFCRLARLYNNSGCPGSRWAAGSYAAFMANTPLRARRGASRDAPIAVETQVLNTATSPISGVIAFATIAAATFWYLGQRKP